VRNGVQRRTRGDAFGPQRGGNFTGSEFLLRFSATSINGFDAGLHTRFYPGPPTLRVPLLNKDLEGGLASAFNSGPEELSGGGGSADTDLYIHRER